MSEIERAGDEAGKAFRAARDAERLAAIREEHLDDRLGAHGEESARSNLEEALNYKDALEGHAIDAGKKLANLHEAGRHEVEFGPEPHGSDGTENFDPEAENAA